MRGFGPSTLHMRRSVECGNNTPLSCLGSRFREVVRHPEQEVGEGSVAEGGYGLALVESMALYWDFVGAPGGPLTVRAAFARSGRIRNHDR